MKQSLITIVTALVAFLVGVAVTPAHDAGADDREARWTQVKIIDDQIMAQAGSGMSITADSIGACGKADYARIEANTLRINELTEQVNALVANRRAKLAELGY